MGFRRMTDILDKIIHEFITPKNVYWDAVVEAAIRASDQDTALRAACMAGRPEFVDIIVDHKPELAKSTILISSDRHKDRAKILSLFDNTLQAIVSNPHIDRSDANLFNYFEVIKYLYFKGLDVDLNEDPLESPLILAHFLAHPELAKDKNHPHFDMVTEAYNQEPPQKFSAPYDFFKDRFPEAVKKFEDALEQESTCRREENLKSDKTIDSPPNWVCVASSAPKPTL